MKWNEQKIARRLLGQRRLMVKLGDVQETAFSGLPPFPNGSTSNIFLSQEFYNFRQKYWSFQWLAAIQVYSFNVTSWKCHQLSRNIINSACYGPVLPSQRSYLKATLEVKGTVDLSFVKPSCSYCIRNIVLNVFANLTILKVVTRAVLRATQNWMTLRLRYHT